MQQSLCQSFFQQLHLLGHLVFVVCVVLFFVGMGGFVVSRPVVGLWGGLVFWFRLFYGCHWDGWSCFFPV
jgi:hypothetical protein